MEIVSMETLASIQLKQPLQMHLCMAEHTHTHTHSWGIRRD